MPESSGEKTEQPTAKKRRDQRKEGNVFQSKEVVTAVSLIGVYYCYSLLFPFTIQIVQRFIGECIGYASSAEDFLFSDMRYIFVRCLLVVAVCALPILLISGIFSVVPTIIQTKGLISFKSIKPKFNKLNPIEGFKKMFSLKGLVELVKSLLKIVLMSVVIYTTLMAKVRDFGSLMGVSMMSAVVYTGEVILLVVKNIAIYFVFIAFLDFLYQKWNYEKDLKMTKHEVKEEYKMTEGDPKVKGKIRQLQQERAQRRMMQQVPSADVVIRNPTHYAVALKYDTKENRSPQVIAKGADFIALKIIEIAKANKVIIKEDKPLARALYEAVDVGREIPEEFYKAVADVLAYVYNLKKKKFGKTDVSS